MKALFRCGRYHSVLPSSPRSVSPGPVCDGRKYRHNQAPSASNSGRGSPSNTFWNPSFRKVPATYHIRLLWRSQAHPGMYQGSPLMPVRNFFSRKAVCRMSVVVRKIKACDPVVECMAQDLLLICNVFSSPKFCHNPSATRGSFKPLLPQRLYSIVS